MFTEWYQLFVSPKTVGADVAQLVKRADGLLQQASAAVVAPGGSPHVHPDDGTCEVRVFQQSTLGLVRNILDEYGLKIEREVKNDA